MGLLAGTLLTLATLAFVLSPLVARLAAPLADGTDRAAELRELYALRDVTYETLWDLDSDFHSGKMSQQDYDDLRGRYKSDALKIVERIERLEASEVDAADERGQGQ